jgi:molecular chaperone DnaK (HSP70)
LSTRLEGDPKSGKKNLSKLDCLSHYKNGSVDDTLEVANMKPDDIDMVVLVGGSSRIPKIKQLLGS